MPQRHRNSNYYCQTSTTKNHCDAPLVVDLRRVYLPMTKEVDLPPFYVPAAVRVGWFFLGRASGVQSPGNGAQLARPHEAANVAGV